MTNEQLQKFLQRFPTNAPVMVKLPHGKVALGSIEMGFDAAPIALGTSNVSWTDMIAEKIEVLVVPEALSEKDR